MEPLRKTASVTPAQAAAAPLRRPPTPTSRVAALQSRIGASGMQLLLVQQAAVSPLPGRGGPPARGAPTRKPAQGGVAPAGKAAAPAQGQADAAAPAAGAKSGKPEAPGGKGGERAAAEQGEAAEAKGEGGGGGGPAIRLHMPEPPTAPSKATMGRIAGVSSRAGAKASAQATLPPAEDQVGDAQKAVTSPEAERAAATRAALIEAVKAAPSPEIVKLCQRIRKAILEQRPSDEDDLLDTDPEAAAKKAGDELNVTVQDEAGKVEANYDSLKTDPPPAPAVPGAPLLAQPAAAPTAAINASAGVPDAVPAGDVSLTKDSDAAKQQIDQAGMNKPAAALVQTGPIAEAREAGAELDQVAKEDPALVLAKQKETLAKAHGDMAALQAKALAALTASRAGTVAKTEARQTRMTGTEEQKREQVSAQANAVLKKAQDDVRDQLKPLVATAMAKWEAEKARLTTDFKAHLAEVQKWVNKRHESTLSRIGDFFTGLPGWVKREYDAAEKTFADGVIAKLTEISAEVEAIIKACEKLIADARKEKDRIFTAAKGELGDWADQEKVKFDKQFDGLAAEVKAERTAFVKNISESASQAVNEVRAEIAELRKKAGGLAGRIADAVRRFVDDPVKFIIDGLLSLVGISPAAFWAVVAKIKKVVADIVDDPVKFANNLLKGIGQGFGLFFDNFPGHMVRGFLTWLLGDLKDVQIPKELSLRGIVTFFLQIMGITWPNIRKIIAKKVGDKNLALIEKVWSLVSFLIEQGPQGIYEMIKEKLDPQAIVDQVIDMAVEFMVTAIAKQAAVRLALLFNPAGAILQAIEAIYRVLKWVFENAARIFALVETIVNGLADIVAGNVGGFAKAVEKGLAMLIAPVLGFIADYFSLGDLPKMVAKQIKSFREWILAKIEGGLDWLIAKGKALLAKLGIGGKDKDKDKGKENADEEIGKKVHWDADGEPHDLWIVESDSSVEVMMASEQKGPVRAKLTKYAGEVAKLTGSDSKDRKARADAAITTARGILDGVIQSAKATKAASDKPDAKPADVKAKDTETETWEDKLWPQLQTIQIALKLIPLPPTVIHPGASQASTVIARPLSEEGSGRSKPRGKLKGWPLVTGRKPQWVAAHLVSEKLHGPGDPWNTTPMRTGDNTRMERRFENTPKKKIAEEEVLYYSVSVSYHQDADVRMNDFPSSISLEWGSMRFDNGKWVDAEAYPAPSPMDLEKPDLEGGDTPEINELRRTFLNKNLGVPMRFAIAMDEERDNGGSFTNSGDFMKRMSNMYKNRGGDAYHNLNAGISAVSTAINEGKAKWPK